jgi:hypothetical protein
VRLGFVIALVAALSNCAATSPDPDQPAMKVIERTRDTRANYAVVSDVFVAFDGIKPQKFRGGEFHRGGFHRVEELFSRAVADCDKRNGHQLILSLGEIESGSQVADASCGIGPFSETAKVVYLGSIEYGFGTADRVQVDDVDFKRTYDVMPDGAIVRNIWRQKSRADSLVYQSKAKLYCGKALPALGFTKSSLDESFLSKACK